MLILFYLSGNQLSQKLFDKLLCWFHETAQGTLKMQVKRQFLLTSLNISQNAVFRFIIINEILKTNKIRVTRTTKILK
jgi:hypothetical protein